MSIMKMYVEEYLAAEQVAENRYMVHGVRKTADRRIYH